MGYPDRVWHAVYRASARILPYSPRAAARLMLAASKHVSEPELHLVSSLIQPGRLSLDIGANWGMYTGELLRRGSEVIAFEPNPTIAAQLERSFPHANVQVCALGNSEATATLRMPVFANGTAAAGWGTISGSALPAGAGVAEISVPVRTLDSFAFKNIGFVKIDVERHEMAVLDGGWQTIARDRPNMLIEAEDDVPEKLAERLAAIGYACTFYLDGKERPFAEWHRGLRTWHGGPPNNFLFRA